MKSSSAFPETEIEHDEARAELDAVLRSVLRPNSNMAQLLQYVCEKHFQGLDHELKEYSVAVEVFDRGADFDSSRDSIVRVEAHRLRSRLARYYKEEGSRHALQIQIAPGSYVPHFVRVPLEQQSLQRHASALQSEAREPGTAGPISVSVHRSNALGLTDSSRQMGLGQIPWFRRAPGLTLLVAALLVVGAAVTLLVRRSRASVASANVSASHPAPLLPAGPDGVVLQMLCGLRSPSFVDGRGETWVGDRYFSGGDAEIITPKPLAFADDPNIYYRRRRADTGNFKYDIPLAQGSYELRLYFADAFFGENNPDGGGEGSRIFDVLANGAYLLKNFDVISDAGGSNTADVKVFRDVKPSADGMLHLQFHSLRNSAFVNAIQILKAAPDAFRPQRFIMASHPYRDAGGNTWEGDRFYRGGVRLEEPNAAKGMPDAELWRNERYGNFIYSIPVGAGRSYAVTMRFRENAPPLALPGTDAANIFDVYLNGRLLLDKFRVEYKRDSGPGQVRTFTHLQPNAQGKLIFSFVPVQNYALVNSVEVVDENGQQ